MAVVHYGDGTEYGQADAYYGRISADMSGAQETQVRETGLIVKLVDERVNRWETILGDADQDPSGYKNTPGLRGQNAAMTQLYWSYRGQADVCILDNGTIVRVRVDIDDLNIYVQEITDPTSVAQWSSWTSLYTGPHYSVAIAPDGNNYVVYGAKADGVYRNNSLVWAATNIMGLTLHRGSDGRQAKDHIWIKKALQGSYSSTGSARRKFDYYHTTNISTTTPAEVAWNYQWFRHDITTITRDDGTMARITSFPMYAPYASNAGESVCTEIVNTAAELRTTQSGARLIRGMPSDYGHNHVSGAIITQLSDGYYYLFYKEIHVDNDFEFSSSPAIALVWQRSKDAKVWSEPVHTGHDEYGFSGIVEKDGFVYICGNGSVYRRPTTAVEYEISDYVPTVEWESPRGNQAGNGQAVVANPQGINDYLMDLSDRRIIIQPGIKTDAGYEFVSLDDFWMKRAIRNTDGNINRLNLEFGNIWSRLDNPLRDVMNFVGRTEYEDWSDGKPNQPFSYYFNGAVEPTVSDNQLVTDGKVLWTGWKGMNPFFHLSFSSSTFSLYLRHQDDDNYISVAYDGGSITLTEVTNKSGSSVSTVLGSVSASGLNRLGVRAVWKSIQVYGNGTLRGTITMSNPILDRPGYVGWEASGTYSVHSFDFEDLEYNIMSQDIIAQALAMGDYHDAKISDTNNKQYALIWGPQTDLPTAGDGLRNVMEADKLELIWRDGYIEVGQFKELGAHKVIEDRIISTEHLNDGNRRVNLANVDGNDSTWMEVDIPDALARDRMIHAYFDLPELLEESGVRNRAIEEIRRSKMGNSPSGTVPLFFDLWRMDPVEWVDNAGTSWLVRIEGMRVVINQSTQPSQRQQLDTSLVE